jgi:hypothetical protein
MQRLSQAGSEQVDLVLPRQMVVVTQESKELTLVLLDSARALQVLDFTRALERIGVPNCNFACSAKCSQEMMPQLHSSWKYHCAAAPSKCREAIHTLSSSRVQ